MTRLVTPNTLHAIAMRARTDSLAFQDVGEELLILDQGSGKIHQLNETASLIWRKFEAGLSLHEVAQFLAEHYDIGQDTAAKDVAHTLQELQALDLVCAE